MVSSWRPLAVSLLTVAAAFALAAALSALRAVGSADRFGDEFLERFSPFLAGMLALGICCGCNLCYGMGVLAGHRRAAAGKPAGDTAPGAASGPVER